MKKKNVKKVVEIFLEENVDRSKPLLLAFSGGVDSLVLYQVFKEFFSESKKLFHVAHLDHQWRESSSSEAFAIREMVEKDGFLFHLHQLDPNEMKGNLENCCRDERYRFFRELYNLYHFQAVVLGHHLNDQSETVLKRVFEGGSLVSLTCMERISCREEMVIWRPLIGVRKREIEEWSREQRLSPIEDSTNFDPRYLRARMRGELLPQLSKMFGKEMDRPLAVLSGEAAELKRFLDQLTDPLFSRVIEGPFGFMWDWEEESLHPYLMKYLVRRCMKSCQLSPTRDQRDKISEALIAGEANLQFNVEGSLVCVDREKLFLFREERACYREWKWKEVEKLDPSDQYEGWRDLWRGKFCMRVEGKELFQRRGESSLKLKNRSKNLGKLRSSRKVPRCLWNLAPVFVNRENFVCDDPLLVDLISLF